MTFRFATFTDCPRLAELNRQIIVDEGHRNSMTAPELEARMRGWLDGEYRAVIFEEAGEVIAYALFREQESEVHLRQLFVARQRRREGIARSAVDILRSDIWPAQKRLTVEVLVQNESAVALWRACGYRDYALTLEIVPLACQ